MKQDKDLKIAIIGFGFLMEYMRPCYEGILGDRISTQVMAVKATDRNLERKRAEFPFPVSVANTPEVLNTLEPDLIMLAPQPSKVKDAVETDLVPYYQKLRQEGKPLPMLMCFAPEPLPRYYCDTLGGNIKQVNLLPCMMDKTGGIKVGHLGHTLVAIDERYPWTEEELDFLRRFLAPVGRAGIVQQDKLITSLTGRVITHNVYELCYAVQDVTTEKGKPVEIKDIASCMRAALAKFMPDCPADPYHCSEQDLPDGLSQFVAKMTENWYEGAMDFGRQMNMDMDTFARTTSSEMYLTILTAQFDSRETLEYHTACHATKGGVLEKACESFAAYCDAPIRKAIADCLDGKEDPAFWAQLRELSRRVSADVDERGNSLSKKK